MPHEPQDVNAAHDATHDDQFPVTGDPLDEALLADAATWHAELPSVEQFAARMEPLLSSATPAPMLTPPADDMATDIGAAFDSAPTPHPTAIPSRSRRRGLLAIAAMAAVVALLAGLFQFVAPRRGLAPNANRPTASAPTWQSSTPWQSSKACDPNSYWPDPGNNITLNGMAMVAPDDGWAIGTITHYGPVYGETVLLHLVQGQWQRDPLAIPDVKLDSIAMVSPTEGWAAGSISEQNRLDLFLLHYSGGRWTRVDLSAVTPEATQIEDAFPVKVVMVSPGNGWLMANTTILRDPKNPASRETSLLLRYHQGAWSVILQPPVTSTTSFWDMDSRTPDDVWLVGTDYQRLTPVIARYAFGQWSVTTQTASGQLESIAMLSATEGWATGEAYPGPNGSESQLEHYDGTNWSQVSLPAAFAAVTLTHVFADAQGNVWIAGVQKTSPGTSGRIVNKPVILQYRGGQWSQFPWPYPDDEYLRAIASVAPGEVWAIANIVHTRGCAPAAVTGLGQGVILHYVNGVWSQTILP
ncbi:MAG: hypothetical protein OJF49_003431 [Ktedonobacterales bacterium]|jgi:hypothetical protein|nr:MAG: hypothetical protein OJF49_003431 [Ktedonobacterales bacterium]